MNLTAGHDLGHCLTSKIVCLQSSVLLFRYRVTLNWSPARKAICKISYQNLLANQRLLGHATLQYTL